MNVILQITRFERIEEKAARSREGSEKERKNERVREREREKQRERVKGRACDFNLQFHLLALYPAHIQIRSRLAAPLRGNLVVLRNFSPRRYIAARAKVAILQTAAAGGSSVPVAGVSIRCT